MFYVNTFAAERFPTLHMCSLFIAANNSTMNKYQEEAQNCSQMYDNALNLITDGQDFTDKLLDFFQGTVRIIQDISKYLNSSIYCQELISKKKVLCRSCQPEQSGLKMALAGY